MRSFRGGPAETRGPMTAIRACSVHLSQRTLTHGYRIIHHVFPEPPDIVAATPAGCDHRHVTAPDPPPRVQETPKQRRDRELIELLNELRLATPGVQLVFGFLLIVPFNARFDDTSTFERGLYVASLLLSAASMILLVGASVQHRLLFRRHFEMRMLLTANRIALLGLTCLGLALLAALLFATHFIFGPVAAASIGTVAGLLIIGVWYVLPLARARRDLPSTPDDE